MSEIEYNEREKWFTDRIGKIVYRNKTSCECRVCENVYQNGLKLYDKMQASYTHECEACYTSEGSILRYFDTKEERDEFEKALRLNLTQ